MINSNNKSPNKTIGLGMIVKASNEEAVGLDTCLKSVAEHVDEIQITITGQNNKVEEIAKKYNANVSYFEWIDDFSAARNYNRSLIKSDWYLWLDADDTLQGAENLHKLVGEAEESNVSGVYIFYEYQHDNNGNCIDAHWKAQLIKNIDDWSWQGAIHEDALPVRPVRWVQTQSIKRIHHSIGPRTKESYERNLRILLKEREKNPNEPRTLFYLGRAYAGAGKVKEAIEILQEYLKLSGWDTERYEAMLIIGKILMNIGQTDDALRVFNDAILEKEEYADAYLQKATAYLVLGDWNKSLNNYKIALGMNERSGETSYNPMLLKRDVWLGIASAYLHLGRLEEAHQAIDRGLKVDPNLDMAKELKQIIEEERTKMHILDNYIEIAKALRISGQENRILPLLHAVPPALSDSEPIVAMKHTYLKPTKWPEKSIAVFCGITAETWGPDSQNNGGIGGSETAVIELSKRLAGMGWKITVFNDGNWPPEGKEIDGISWQNYWTFNPDDEFDVLWSWRYPELFDYNIRARVAILDLHDVMNPFIFTEDRLKKINKVFVKTSYHRSLYPNVPDKKFVVVGNGVDLSRWNIEPMEKQTIEDERKSNPHRFIYSSTPNRGLDIVLQMWPKIREKIKDAELHIFYGWNTYYKIEKNNPERMAWMKKIQEKVHNTEGIIDHGRVGQKELAIEQLKSSFWIYPTYFPEIHCITACEMQAAGVIPLTSGYAALAETQQSGISMSGDVHSPVWQEQFIEQIVQIVEDKEFQKAEREKAIEVSKQFSWDKVAEEWDRELSQKSNAF